MMLNRLAYIFRLIKYISHTLCLGLILYSIYCILFLCWEFLLVTTFASFTVPTGSMSPTILPGESIYVNKWTIGGRIFNIFDAAKGKPVSISRLPGLRQIEQNDILVFNYPYHLYDVRYDSIRLNMKTYFVKRCIGLPGSDIEIRKGRYMVNGKELEMTYDHNPQLESNLQYQEWLKERTVFRIDTTKHWTQKEFGPLHIPYRGEKIELSESNIQMFRNLIEWEQHKRIKCLDGDIYLSDSLISSYHFLQDYYFMAGDNFYESEDSRFWGLVPADLIVGVASFIWKSKDPITRKMRWDRFLNGL